MSGPLTFVAARERRDATVGLAHGRGRVVGGLSALMIVAFFAFMGAFAFDKPLLGTVLAPGLTLCLVLGPALILGGFLVSVAYVLWANLVFDPALERAQAVRVARAEGQRHAR